MSGSPCALRSSACLATSDVLLATCARPRPSPRPSTIAASARAGLRSLWPFISPRWATQEQAIAAGQRALALADGPRGCCPQQAQATIQLGRVYYALGDYRQAIDYSRQAVVAYLEGERAPRALWPGVPARRERPVSSWSGACRSSAHSPRAALLGIEGLRIAEAVDHPEPFIAYFWGLGLLALRQGDLHRGRAYARTGLGLVKTQAFCSGPPVMAAALGAAYARSGVLQRPAAAGAGGGAGSRHAIRVDQTLRVLGLSAVSLLTSRLEEARSLAERALELAQAYKERGHQAYALRLLGDIAARHDPPDVAQAEAHYQQALALAEELGMRPLQAHCHSGLGMLYTKTGQQEQARAALSTAMEMYRTMEMTFWLPQVEAALAQVE